MNKKKLKHGAFICRFYFFSYFRYTEGKIYNFFNKQRVNTQRKELESYKYQ